MAFMGTSMYGHIADTCSGSSVAVLTTCRLASSQTWHNHTANCAIIFSIAAYPVQGFSGLVRTAVTFATIGLRHLATASMIASISLHLRGLLPYPVQGHMLLISSNCWEV